MVSVWMILAAIGVLCFSGVPGCLFGPRSPAGQRIAALLMAIGGVLGVGGMAASLGEAAPPSLRVPWVLPWGQFAATIDAISVLFLAPVFVVPALGSIYGLSYWKQSEHPESGRRLGLFYGLMAGAMALVVVARDGVLFLMAWEVMALAAYFALVAEEESNPQVRRAGWVYLIATHMGTLCLFALFALWRRATGSFALEPAQAIPAALAGPIFVLALVGFSFKAGLFPFHFWLPGAHANAPSHVSAVMSGVLLKMGIYGLVRISALLPQPPVWWGATLLAAGVITGVFGIACALGQRDMKRLLAYSSVENIGVIATGLGLALLGRAMGQIEWALLGLGGALLHVWNHALFKPLLFLNAGAVLHAAHTREMDRLGGLAKGMPITMSLFAVGAVAICALPPLNGFASEWLLYLGLIRTLGEGTAPGAAAVATGAVALAIIGALAVACFVKLMGAVFLGSPRSAAAHHAHDPPASMIAPMAVLAAGCVGVGLFPIITAPLLEEATRTWAGLPPTAHLSLTAVAPLAWITRLGLALIAMAAVIVLALKLLPRWRVTGKAGTWDCGYAQPTPRMQYTGSSFAQTLVSLLAWLIWPRRRRLGVAGLFARASRYRADTPDLVLDRGLLPGAAAVLSVLPWVRRFQQGRIHSYLLYVLLIVVFLFLLAS